MVPTPHCTNIFALEKGLFLAPTKRKSCEMGVYILLVNNIRKSDPGLGQLRRVSSELLFFP